MRIKKFVGASMKEVTDQMRAELGPDAIILNSRRVNSGSMLNFLGKEMLEVTAAVDEQSGARANPVSPDFGQLLREQTGTTVTEQNTLRELSQVAQRFEKRAEKAVAAHRGIVPNDADVQVLRSEMEEMRSVLATIADQMKYSRMPSLPAHLQESYVALVQNGVDERLAADLVQSIYGRMGESQLANRVASEKALLAALAGLIRTASPVTARGRKRTVIALVGPTGVGKTTTIAKLAAIHKLIHHEEVGLISADTYRIGAIEQLRTFAGIADIPMEVAYTPADVTAALKTFRRKDVVFIDTVGRSQRAKKELNELKRFIDAASPDETSLVLNAGASVPLLKDTVDRFRVLKPTQIIFSKLDETLTPGAMVSVARHSKLPIAYVTTGQTVPDDIAAADAAKLASIIFHGAVAHA